MGVDAYGVNCSGSAIEEESISKYFRSHVL